MDQPYIQGFTVVQRRDDNIINNCFQILTNKNKGVFNLAMDLSCLIEENSKIFNDNVLTRDCNDINLGCEQGSKFVTALSKPNYQFLPFCFQ